MDESMIDRLILWMVSGMSVADLEHAAVAKLQVEPDKAKALVAEARKRLTLAADYSRDELLGTALTRLNDLYARCIRQSDERGPNLAKALDVQREINRLAGLYRQPALDVESPGATSDTDAELDAIAEHLLPLNLASPDYPLREHARLAAQWMREAEQVTGIPETTPSTARPAASV